MRKLRFGLWYDFRNPPQWRQDPTRLYESIIAQAARAEVLGWDDVWLSEHHFIEDGYTPSMLPLAAAIAARTQKIRIGTSVLLLPLHDPLRVAEDSATIDIVSGGRFDLGIGAGYRVGEFRGFAIPRRERDERMGEAVEVLRRCFAGERFSFEGKYYRYRDVQLFPPPLQKPMPPRVFLHASRGFADDPPGLYPQETVDTYAARWPDLDVRPVPDVNHYTIVLSRRGADAVAQAVRDVTSAS